MGPCIDLAFALGDSTPQKQFDRNASLGSGTQIISYQTSDDGKWCLLVGISQGDGGAIVGNMQLYSKDKKVSQVLQGHAGAFATITPPGRTDTGQVLCFAGTKGGGPQQVGKSKSKEHFHLYPVAFYHGSWS